MGRFWSALTLFFVGLFASRGAAAPDQPDYHVAVEVRTNVPVDGKGFTIAYDGGNPREMTCQVLGRPTDSKETKLRCEDTIFFRERPPSTARVEIRTPGYKIYSRNIPGLRPGTSPPRSGSFRPVLDMEPVNLGAISLVATEAPLLERVIRMQSSGTSPVIRYELTLKNPLKKAVLVKELRFSAERPGKDLRCCCPPDAYVDIKDSLRLTASSGNTKSVAGVFEESVRNSGYDIAFEGLIQIDGCKGAIALHLNLPTSFQLPAEKRIAVIVQLPKAFKIAGAKSADGSDLAPPFAVATFKRLTFTLVTTEKDELPIVGRYIAPAAEVLPPLSPNETRWPDHTYPPVFR